MATIRRPWRRVKAVMTFSRQLLCRHVALRPEVRLVAGGAGSSVIDRLSAELRFSMGLGYHW
jgi:hypothetical protein